MIVNVTNEQSALRISIDQTQQIVQSVLSLEGRRCDEVNVYFVDTPTICALHEQFFQDPSPTDCISFPMDGEQETSEAFPHHLLGEVVVCPATAVAYASQHRADPYEETTLYLVHSLLHLLGYDDLEEADCRLMRQAELRCMEELRAQNLMLRYAQAN